MKFSCYYDEGCDNFGDSCGSAESEEGSDSEPDVDNNLDNGEYINITTIKKENTEEDCDLEVSFCSFHWSVLKLIWWFLLCDKVTDVVYDELEEDQEILRAEMVLAQKDLLQYERSLGNKRRKVYLLPN